MLEISINGKSIEVENGTTILNAASKLGIYIPHFCYHKHLSIAANCRMCLVEIENFPKPVPACSALVNNKLKVITDSPMVKEAQRGVLEFLLINHPLDCPICDQGGECQLQDLAIGYGATHSNYQESKRTVNNKYLGPLISTELTRCIHCTRCIRFSDEVSGTSELGMINRGSHSEITSMIVGGLKSELSGNMIDICPVGALTSKPFRFSARNWELSRKRGISPNDAVCSNLIIQTKLNKVYRILPLENQDLNETWISDRDRFSYVGVNSDYRLKTPRIRINGVWEQATWDEALSHLNAKLKPRNCSIIAHPTCTLEELYLLKELSSHMHNSYMNYYPYASDPTLWANGSISTPDIKINELESFDNVLLIGSSIRLEQPLLAYRLRRAYKNNKNLHSIHVRDDALLIPKKINIVIRPSELVAAVSKLLLAAYRLTQVDISAVFAGLLSQVAYSIDDLEYKELAKEFLNSKSSIYIGAYALSHPEAGIIKELALEISRVLDSKICILGHGGNFIGGCLLNAYTDREMYSSDRDIYIVFNNEPAHDSCLGVEAILALEKANYRIAMGSYINDVDYLDLQLPIASFVETSGSYANMNGDVQEFIHAIKAEADILPGWQAIVKISKCLGFKDLDHSNISSVRASMDIKSKILNWLKPAQSANKLDLKFEFKPGIERITELGSYSSSPLLRRADCLQECEGEMTAFMSKETMEALNIDPYNIIILKQNNRKLRIKAEIDSGLLNQTIRLLISNPNVNNLGSWFSDITIEKE